MMKVTNDFYRQLEELNEKIDSLLQENKLLREEFEQEKKELLKSFKQEKAELKLTIKSLTNQLEESNKLNKKLQDDIDRLKNQINKNSNNSSKPSSTDIVTPKKKTGANLYNYRIISGKKAGGQKGHTGHSLSKEKVEKLIDEKKIEVREIQHKINNKNKEDIIKYRLGLEIKVYVEKHIFKHDENSNKVLPKAFYTDVTYDNKIKALSIQLGTYNVVAIDRMSDFFNILSEGILQISNGTLVNFTNEFSNKSMPIINNLETELLNNKTIFTDETSAKYNKLNIYIRNYSNENTVLYKSHNRKGHKALKDHNILPRFTGGIVHDHDTTIYSYGTKHYECIIHLGRYLEEIIENVHNIIWPRLLKELLFKTYKERKNLIVQGINSFTSEQIMEYEKRYDEIIFFSKEENESIKSLFYKNKAKALSNRCEKYKHSHLAFVKDFDVPFDNNLSERALRIVKIKTKVSGGFRSENGCENYCNTLSIINTAKMRGINPFKAIISVYNNENIFAN